MKDSFDEIFQDVNNILIVMAHPDDNEVICGGTLARLISEGKKVRLIVTTNGGKGMGSQDLKEEELALIRIKEQVNSAMELGLNKNEVFNLNLPDGQVETTF